MRLTLTYFDQADSLTPEFPVTGLLERSVVARSGDSIVAGGKWSLLRLDKPIQYQHHKDGRYWLTSYDWLLLKPRFSGEQIGGSEPTHVFVLFVDDVTRVADNFDCQSFWFAVWAVAELELDES